MAERYAKLDVNEKVSDVICKTEELFKRGSAEEIARNHQLRPLRTKTP